MAHVSLAQHMVVGAGIVFAASQGNKVPCFERAVQSYHPSSAEWYGLLGLRAKTAGNTEESSKIYSAQEREKKHSR